ncbi:DUF418 family protein [Xenorhabdus nematophila]|uniref:DUF418 domain-containing protein YeiB n=2 Tax=Xenorhabdus nematophila TaxID=628 RepID=UPI000544076C|nr:DUF418 domain-containing protein YeiB [Xenorhabdus nematophila]CEE94430.1 putative flavoprotein [Xenorhabdus nematophila str. Anatoliense]CEF29946.1 putative flavoprotein [Xenorhabdus nematophila str. Websteri]AYA40766.1 DUF418 family protein [Xenorhabdus nematophila]KHD29551.1 hypothetical protein LH67_02360 [Xenorhabdus nematophila]MBA0019510.1 DUF418 family protein [Xenorhabdus nematophila]
MEYSCNGVMNQRIEILDSLRGFAILGILLLNITSFALPYAAYMNLFYQDSVSFSDVVTWSALSVFTQGKFLFILTLLFGAALELLRQRGRNGNIPRLLILAVIGLLHGILLWDGDILLSYGIVGLLAWHFINTRQKLFSTGVTFYLSGVMMFYLLGLFPVGDNNSFWMPTPDDIFHESAWKIHGGLLAAEYRIRQISGAMIVVIAQYGWQIMGVMLCGAMLLRNGWLKGEFSHKHYRHLALCLLPAGMMIQCAALSIQYLYPYSYFASWTIRYTITELATPLLALAYISLIYGFWPAISRWRVTFWLRQVGRMALSSYLLQTLVCTTLFYRFELFGKFTRLELIAFIPFIWALNIWFACWWLKRYSQGPMEQLWRYLTAKLT